MLQPSHTQTSFARRTNHTVLNFDGIIPIKLCAERHGCKDDEETFFKNSKHLFHSNSTDADFDERVLLFVGNGLK